jgi:CBS domain-containing protein/sporulation protein YlmC with PRC-barrel domain
MHSNLLPESSLSLLQGTPVVDGKNRVCGSLSDIAVGTGTEAGKVTGLVLKTKTGRRLVDVQHVQVLPSGLLQLREGCPLQALDTLENHLLLHQDIVDQQIIDVHGRKVVRVNDVDLSWRQTNEDERALHVTQVEVGLRGALRRLLKGTMPAHQLDLFSRRFTARVIPWEFVDFIEVDPARRVKLKIEHQRLASMHPSDIADILEELAPAEREAVFGSLDEETAAEALEEIHPKLQQSLTESLDSSRVADIVEEMDPGAAADFLAELPEDRSEAILEQMEPEERQEVEELLEFRDNSAAGRMTTDFIQLPESSTVADAIAALQNFDGSPETITDIYLVDEKDVLKGAVALSRMLLVLPDTALKTIRDEQLISCAAEAHEDEVAELFDKYNLRALPVTDEKNVLVGVVQADHVISFLRKRE